MTVAAPPSLAPVPSSIADCVVGLSYVGDLKVTLSTWNCESIFGMPKSTSSQLERQRLKRRRVLCELVHTDVMCLQEAHGNDQDVSEFRAMSPSHYHLASMIGATGGLVTCIRKSLVDSVPSCIVLVQGFLTITVCKVARRSFLFCNIHSHPQWSQSTRLSHLRSLHSVISRYSDAVVFVAGDFNTVVEGEYRLTVSSGKRTSEHHSSLQSSFESVFQHL